MLILYHHGSSVCAAKVRLALAEKGIEWEGRYVDILKGDQFTPEFRKLSPKALVPVLVDGDRVTCESTIINAEAGGVSLQYPGNFAHLDLEAEQARLCRARLRRARGNGLD